MRKLYKNGKTISIIIISLFTFFIYLIYSSVSGFGAIGYSPVWIFVPIIVYTAMFFGGFSAFFFGLGVGFLLDCTAATNPYFNIIVLMVIGLAAGVFSKIFINVNIISGIFVSLIFSFLYSFLNFFVNYISTVEFEGFWFLFFNKVVLSTVYTTIFGILFYILIKRVWYKFCNNN